MASRGRKKRILLIVSVSLVFVALTIAVMSRSNDEVGSYIQSNDIILNDQSVTIGDNRTVDVVTIKDQAALDQYLGKKGNEDTQPPSVDFAEDYLVAVKYSAPSSGYKLLVSTDQDQNFLNIDVITPGENCVARQEITQIIKFSVVNTSKNLKLGDTSERKSIACVR